jgi:FkbM family methyltransferase
MSMGVFRLLAGALPARLKSALLRTRHRLFDHYAVKSYSQEGEDIILRRIFDGQKVGFYVDVGAHHPRRFSNTHIFYRRGWYGINIEPNPDAFRLFQSDRGRDTNLQLGVSDRPGRLTYYQFDESALNTFDETLAFWRLANTPFRLVTKIEVAVERLDDILERALPANQCIDFLSIDVEGLDFAVLQSNDWQRFRPTCVLVEALGTSLENIIRSELFAFMKSQGYVLFAKMFNTLIFRDSRVTMAPGGAEGFTQ